MISTRWTFGCALVVGLVLAAAEGCGSDSSGGGGTGGASNAAGSGGASGRGGTSGASGRGGGGGAPGRDGGIPDGFNLDGLNLDAILADAGITSCAAGVANGSACTPATDTGCLPASGASFCFCQNGGTWSCF